MNSQDVAEFLLYSKLQDVVMFLGNNAVIKMNVMLYHTNRRGVNGNERQYFYRETQYLDTNGNLCRGVQRTFNSFLTLENLKPGVDGIKQCIFIRAGELELMRIMLLPRLENYIAKMGEIYEMRENKLYINESVVNPIQIDIGNQTIWFKPGIFKKYDGSLIPAVNMYLNSLTNYVTLTYNEIYTLMYHIRTFDIYTAATNMIAFYGRPPMGLNMYDYSSEQVLTPTTGFTYKEPEYIRKKRSNTEGFFVKEQGRRKKKEE